MVDWSSLKGVVTSDGDRAVLVEVGLERLMGIRGEGVRVLHFLALGISMTRVGLAVVSVFVCVGGGIVVHLSICMESVFLPFGSLSMVEALCGVGEN